MLRNNGGSEKLYTAIAELHSQPSPENALPPETSVVHARKSLVQHLPASGLGVEKVIQHLQEEITPGFNQSSRSSRYYGFVTGGATPAAALADNLVTLYDQNAAAHLPNETIATDVEDKALSLLCELLKLEPSQFPHRTFTTGATASNVLGLACGREYIVNESGSRNGTTASVGELGILEAVRVAGLDRVQILTTVPHSSLSKAASLVGIGRSSVVNVALEGASHRFDMGRLKELLQVPRTASIVAISASEVNTGLFATSGLEEMQEIRKLCDAHGAWLHVDGAFGIMARLLTDPAYTILTRGCAGLDLADSITGDGHKLLNVPYDCGFFLSRHRSLASHVFQNPNAAYLSTGPSQDSILQPMNSGIENSRRFRALPVYASLVAYGRDGYRDMLERQIGLARGIAGFLFDSEDFELLPESGGSKEEVLANIYIIVLFRAKDEGLNNELVSRIKDTKKIYVSGTAWEGKPACRFAISNWMNSVQRDLPVIRSVLEGLVKEWKGEAAGY